MTEQATPSAHPGAGDIPQGKDTHAMNDRPQCPVTGAPPGAVPAALEAILEEVRSARQHHADDLFRRLGRGERLAAEQLYDTLRAQTLCTWWLLVARHIKHTENGGLSPAQSVARYVSWITSYLADPTPPEPGQSARAGRQEGERELALAHLGHSLALIRQGAARTFLAQAETLAPACSASQAPGASIGQEATA